MFAKRYREVVERYIESFAHAHETFGAAAEVVAPNMECYVDVLVADYELIYRNTRTSVERYLNAYDVEARSPDIWKMLYFTGRRIEDRLIGAKDRSGRGLTREIALIHLTAMVGMLDLQLTQAGLSKSLLRQALLRVIREDSVNREMGETGIYLIYKTLSTWDRDRNDQGQGEPT